MIYAKPAAQVPPHRQYAVRQGGAIAPEGAQVLKSKNLPQAFRSEALDRRNSSENKGLRDTKIQFAVAEFSALPRVKKPAVCKNRAFSENQSKKKDCRYSSPVPGACRARQVPRIKPFGQPHAHVNKGDKS